MAWPLPAVALAVLSLLLSAAFVDRAGSRAACCHDQRTDRTARKTANGPTLRDAEGRGQGRRAGFADAEPAAGRERDEHADGARPAGLFRPGQRRAAGLSLRRRD